MSKRKWARSPEISGKTNGWLTTFNDLVTLLMVFFVLLFTMGSMDKNLMKEFQNALQSGLGILAAGSKVSVAVNESQRPVSMEGPRTQGHGEATPGGVDGTDVIDDAMSEFAAEPGINVKYSDQAARISFEDALLFNFGKADINLNGLVFLDKMAALIHKIPCMVRVEGHTDNVPIHTHRFPSNWDLSTARAVSVVKYFVDVGKINPQRLSAVGYGESRPIVPNDSAANRARNRRVEIVLVTEGEK
ncbi:MAG: flagellar motor protein MotB [Desulfobacterales bacterium]|nr:MAG: flagellar motor protein MotB [Desulfobacterales bacterium]